MAKKKESIKNLDAMAVERNKERLRITSTNFEFEDLSINDLRKIVRASLAVCSRVSLHDVRGVRVKELYVTQNEDCSLSYEYHYTHGPIPFQSKYTQGTLDKLARKYHIAV